MVKTCHWCGFKETAYSRLTVSLTFHPTAISWAVPYICGLCHEKNLRFARSLPR